LTLISASNIYDGIFHQKFDFFKLDSLPAAATAVQSITLAGHAHGKKEINCQKMVPLLP
jgi:hypothetical protein